MSDKLDFFERPWAITEDAFEALASFDQDQCESSPALASITAEMFNEKLRFQNDSGVAVLDISGPLMPNPSIVARFFMGAVDSLQVENLIRAAQDSPEVKALLLNFDCCGGTVVGTPEIGNAVKSFAAKKSLYVFSSGTVASAAYWIAAGASEVYGTESSRWGSVGVMRPHIDRTEERAKAGVSVEIFTSGKHKGAGAMNTALTPEQRNSINLEMERLGEKFRAHVSEQRPNIKREDMEAQVYYADEAVSKGYVDEIVDNFKSALSKIEKKLSVDNSNNGSGNIADSTNKKDTMTEQEMQDKVDAAEAALNTANTKASDDAKASADLLEQATTEATQKDVIIDGLKAELKTAKETATEATDKVDELADKKAKILAVDIAAKAAAKIAAESGTDPANVTGGEGSADSDDDYTGMSEAKLWDAYKGIREKDGDKAAHAFYVKHLDND